MEVLQRNNYHILKEDEEKEYGCVCEKCGTVFIFKEHEGDLPRCLKPKAEYCTICCPNCKRIIRYSDCTEFKSTKDKDEFKHKYDE